MVKVGRYNYELSPKKDKKLRVTVKGKTIDFGQKGYEHFFDRTGLLPKKLNHGDKERRKDYLSRSKGITDKEGKLTWKDPTSANYHAIRILW